MFKRCIELGILAFLAPLMAVAAQSSELNTSSNHTPKSYSTDPVDGGWLPDLTGLPDKNQVLLLKNHAAEVMNEETDSRCNAINKSLKLMVFRHFVIRQEMANNQNVYFDEKTAYQWAHVLGMLLKESSGDTASITDMTGRSMSTFTPQTNLEHWRKILSLSAEKGRIHLNSQTNFGLTQTSADRLFVAFKLAEPQKYTTSFLEGKEGSLTSSKKLSNTAIAVRRLIWFYQDFAQGRVVQADSRINEYDISKPEFSDRHQNALDMALVYCGSRYMFESGPNHPERLKNALGSIAYCKLGNAKSGYG
ncbi:MAG: hypothetical protein H0T84_03960, partial [Tatlockia sp.]|nr:hypothetical protein [Tatlockia sp.]